MKKYKVNYYALASGILLFIFALVFAKIIPGGETLQYVIIIVSFVLAMVARFYKKQVIQLFWNQYSCSIDYTFL